MMTSLKKRVAVVTGASRGLGQYVAVGLAKQGASLALIARSEDGLKETQRLIQDEGGQALVGAINVADPDAVDRFRYQVESEFGSPSILVNAAGIFGPIQKVHQSDSTAWIETIMTNTIGPYVTCRAFVAAMINVGWGRIINFSSAATLHPPGPLNSAYATSKVALNQFTRHLAAELEGSGVTANVIHPGEVRTSMWAAIREQSAISGIEGEGLRNWAAEVGKSGGDDPQKTLDLVLDSTLR